MKTWSIANVVDQGTLAFTRLYTAAAVAVQAALDLAGRAERLTRPARRGAAFDEELAVSPDGYYGYAEPDLGTPEPGLLADDRGTGAINNGEPQQVTLSGREFERYLEGALNDPGLDEECNCEPSLSDDELVGVRGLLQERYVDSAFREPGTPMFDTGVETGHDMGLAWAAELFPQHTSASNHTGTGAEPTPSPTRLLRTGDRGVDGEGSPADSDIQPSPAGERPPHPVPREQRQGTYCEDYETDGCSVDVCPDGCYHALKFREDAVAEWIGEAVPVISEVLAEHYIERPTGLCRCGDWGTADLGGWRAHVAPLIANALAPQEK